MKKMKRGVATLMGVIVLPQKGLSAYAEHVEIDCAQNFWMKCQNYGQQINYCGW